MKELPDKWRQWLRGKNWTDGIKFGALPFGALVLIVIILAVDPGAGGQNQPSQAAVQMETSETETLEGEAAEDTVLWENQEETVLEREAVPKIHDLMDKYFTGRKECDLLKLQEVYGDTCTQTELYNERNRLLKESAYYQDYYDLECYTAPGLEEGDYVVFARFQVKFRQADTLVPALVAAYARSNGDGTWNLAAVPEEGEQNLINELSLSSQVQKMALEVNNGLREALETDENLLAVYNELMPEEETQTEVSVETEQEEAGEPSADAEESTEENTGEA